MALSDCEKCWETPCCCGHKYKYHSTESFANYIANIVYGAKGKNNAIDILKLAIKQIESE